jgi:hypothetical protein
VVANRFQSVSVRPLISSAPVLSVRDLIATAVRLTGKALRQPTEKHPTNLWTVCVLIGIRFLHADLNIAIAYHSRTVRLRAKYQRS